MKKIKKEDFTGDDIDKVSGIEDTENQDAAEAEAEKKDVEAEVLQGKNLEEELQDQKDRYLRLYAEFENYKKRAAKDKEELVKYGNESLLYELLPVLDNLEMALKHSPDSELSGLIQGVEITLKEFLRALDRFGLAPIVALERAFDPSLHHAMTQVERDDVDEHTVVEEFRKGYMLRDKVLRPSLVAVSTKKAVSDQPSAVSDEESLTLNTDTDTNKNIIEEEI